MTSREDITAYLEVCGYAPDDLISVGTRAGADGPIFFSFVRVADAPRQIEARQRVNCWLSAGVLGGEPAPRKDGTRGRGEAKDIARIPALWADLDIGEGKLPSRKVAWAVVKEVSRLLGVDPVAVVHSGHGYQPRWRFAHGDITDLPELVEGFGRLVRKVAEECGGKADNVYDLARIIRAPGTTNIKPDLESVPTRVAITASIGREPTVMATDLRRIIAEHAPAPVVTPATPKEENVDRGRGDRYVGSVLDYIAEELDEIKGWPVGKTDERGRGWEKIQADAAYRLAELAKADWNHYDERDLKTFFIDHAPIDDGWTQRDVLKKWNAQWKRAEPAQPPAVVDDPLAPGYRGGDAPPLPGAPAEDIWAGARTSGKDATDHEAGEGGGTSGGRPADDGVVPAAAAGGTPPVAGGGGAAGAAVPWRKYTWDDFGNAERTVALHGALLHYSPMLKRWFAYADGAWRESETGGEKAVQDMVRRLPDLESGLYSTQEYREGRRVTTQRNEFLDFVKTCRSASKVKAASTVMKNDGELDVSAAVFDNDPMLLNATNGVIELRSGELLDHAPELMLRRQIPVAFDPDAKAPLWEAYLNRVMPDPLDRAYLHRIVGYSITGRTSEQAVFVHHGVTHNGKSVFLRVLEAMLGDFSRVVPPTTLIVKRNEAHPTDIMGLEGRRLLQVSELPEGARLEEALVKRLSGEETITARGMGQDFRDFKITGKIHIVTNPLPHIGDDPATKRRIHMVEWKVTIPVEERDPLLADRIIAQELPGVLAWAVRGCLEWGRTGLQPPVGAQMNRDEYFASEDEFGEFIDEELILGADSFTPTRDLYRRYAQWCDGGRIKPMSKIAFARKLSARGIRPARTTTTRGFAVALATPRWTVAPPDPLS